MFSAEGLLVAAKSSVAELVTEDGKISSAALDREQRATHALAWLATYVEALRQMVRWARGLEEAKKFGEIEQTHSARRVRRVSGAVAGRHRDEPERNRPALRPWSRR